MMFYGNTPRDIMRMMWKRKFKFLTIAVLIFIAVTLIGCTKPAPKLKALDQFWDTLGGKALTKSKDE
jgi:hypothetical protein